MIQLLASTRSGSSFACVLYDVIYMAPLGGGARVSADFRLPVSADCRLPVSGLSLR